MPKNPYVGFPYMSPAPPEPYIWTLTPDPNGVYE